MLSRARTRRAQSLARVPASALLIGAAMALGTLGLHADEARAASGFGATASAFAARVTLHVEKAPISPTLVDVGGPGAQAALDSLGTTEGLAAFPYPGDLVLNLPGLAAGLGPQLPSLVSGVAGTIGGSLGLPHDVVGLLDQIQIPSELIEPIVANAPSVPPYPFVARADPFTPKDSQDLGFGHLAAGATAASASASAVSEPGASGANLVPLEAHASVRTSENGDVVAEASGTTTGLQVGPVKLGTVSSTARVTRSSDGRVLPETSFSVSAIELAGLDVGLTTDGFTVAGVPVPAPLAATLNQILQSSGIELAVLPSQVTETSVVAGGLRITRTQDLGSLGMGQLTTTLGQSSVTLALSPLTGSPPSPGGLGAGSADPSTSSGGAGLPAAAGPGSTPGSSSVALTPGPAHAIGVDGRSLGESFELGAVYLLLVAAALAAAGTGQLLRLAAFRPHRTPAEVT